MKDKKKRRLIAGCMRWGIWGYKLDKSGYQEMIQSCLDEGITTFDHADIYGDHTTESEFGVAWRDMNIKREDIELISKCGIKLESKYGLKSYDNSKQYILESVGQSLAHLQTEYLDLLLIHRPSPLMDPEVIAEAVTVLKKAGKLKQFGVSNFTTAQMNLLGKYVDIAVNQIELSPIRTSAFVDGTLDYMQANDIQTQAWSPLAISRDPAELTTKKAQREQRLTAVAEKNNWTRAELSLLFLKHHPAGISPIIGTTKPERIKAAALSMKKSLTDEQWFEIWTAVKGQKVA